MQSDSLKNINVSEYDSIYYGNIVNSNKVEFKAGINQKKKISTFCVSNGRFRVEISKEEGIAINEIIDVTKSGLDCGINYSKISEPIITSDYDNLTCNNKKEITIEYGTMYSGYTYRYKIDDGEYEEVNENPTFEIDKNSTIIAEVYRVDELIRSKELSVLKVGNEYTVTYEKNGADSIGKTSDKCCADTGKSCTVIAPSITRANYDIIGWNTDASATTGIIEGGNITLDKDETFYAITKENIICTPATDEQRKVDMLSDGKKYGYQASGNYNPGDAYLCKVNSSLKYVFFVFSSTETTVDLIYNRNLVAPDKTGPDIYWSDTGRTNTGPLTALAFLKAQTNNWTNIAEKTNNYSSTYYSITHIARARIPSYAELASLGVRTTYISYISNPEWLYTNIGTCSSTAYWYPPYDLNACHGNSMGYWTYTPNSYSEAWYVYGNKYFATRTVNVVNCGVRPIITVNKTQISN